MTKSASPPASEAKPKKRPRRRTRPRPTPKWLLSRQDLDEVARRRCLMVLSVLSGEKPVSDAIAEAKLSRGTYYHLEERAMQAMLRALSPLAGPDGTESLGLELALGQVKEQEKKVARLEQDKRRLERLLYTTRKVVKPGPLVVEGRRGRPRGRRSTPNGPSGSPASTPTVKTSPSEASTPSSTSGAGRSPGSEN
jgi:hypothetical protein